MMEPYDWQRPIVAAAVSSLRESRVFICGAGTGVGKTVVALAALKELGCPGLVVAPKVARSQWLRTAEAMACAGQVVDVVNPEKISSPRGCAYYSRDALWRIPRDCLVVFDEIHRGASGEKSVTTLAVAQLKAYPSARLLALSATVADSPLKLRALGYWLGFHSFALPSFRAWCAEHGCKWEEFGWGRNRKRAFAFTKSAKRGREEMARIRADMGARFLAVGPDEVPGFPAETLEVLRLDLGKSDRDGLERAYAAMPQAYLESSKDVNVAVLRERERAEFCKAEAIAERAAAFESDGLSVFVLVNFTAARERIEEFLKEKKIKCASIYGGQNDEERQRGIDAFQNNDVHVLVAMAAAASCALSAHDAKHERPRVSLISPGYNASDVKQGLGRIRRVNGTDVVQYFVVAADTVEERVAKTLERKLGNIDALNDADLARA